MADQVQQQGLSGAAVAGIVLAVAGLSAVSLWMLSEASEQELGAWASLGMSVGGVLDNVTAAANSLKTIFSKSEETTTSSSSDGWV